MGEPYIQEALAGSLIKTFNVSVGAEQGDQYYPSSLALTRIRLPSLLLLESLTKGYGTSSGIVTIAHTLPYYRDGIANERAFGHPIPALDPTLRCAMGTSGKGHIRSATQHVREN